MKKTAWVCLVLVLWCVCAASLAPAEPALPDKVQDRQTGWSAGKNVSETSLEERVLSLDDCYALALKRSENIGILMQRIEEVEGQYLQALSTITPTASFLLKEFHQDSPQGNNEGAGALGSSFTRESQPERKFKISQPLFQGFKSLAAMGGAQSLKVQKTESLQRGKELLFLDVVTAFYGVMGPRDEVESLQKIREFLEQRIKELEERVQLGRSRPSEVVMATAQLKQVQAQIEQTRRSEVATVIVLYFLTGLNHIKELVDSPELPAPVSDLKACMIKGRERSDVKAARAAVEAAKQNVIFARSGIFPTLMLDTNLYTKRVGYQSDTDWDMTMTFNVPLFEWIRVSGAMREAYAKLRIAEYERSRVERLVEAEVRSAYEEFRLSSAAAEAFREAEEAADKNFEIQTKEYRLNLVNNLDVLAALQELETVRRDYLKARYQAKRDWNRLKVAVGDIQ